MTVIRVNKTGDFTVMSNTHFREKEMSLKAKGLLSLMLSLPDEWDYSIAGLATLSKDGRDGVNSGLTELEEFGYLVRSRRYDKEGKFAGYNYDIYEQPRQTDPCTEKPCTENPYTEKPYTENPQQLNTNKSNTKELNTQIINKNRRFSPPTLDEVTAYCNERGNKVDPARFIDYYTANGWKVGKNPMRDWKATVRNWERTSRSAKTYGANGVEIKQTADDDLAGIL